MDPHGTRRRRLAVDQGTAGTHLAAAPAAPPWSELPVDALSSVLASLGVLDTLVGAGLVCRSWLRAARLPDPWRSVDMASHKLVEVLDNDTLRAMAMVAADRSGGQLEAFIGKRFADDDLLKYIGDRAPSLKRLCIISCKDVSNDGLAEAIIKFPQLDELELSLCSNIDQRHVFEAVGNSCPELTRFRRSENRIHRHGHSSRYKDKEAMGIATMTKLRSLHLFGNSLTGAGLAAILGSCPLLESLDIRHCCNIKMDDALPAKCAGLKTLRLPEDSIDGYEFQDHLPSWSPYIVDLISDDDESD
ncbi:hypothetical protein C2845_PM13G05100 [Panicum miliaceum]|uniref:F-box domain-containing protein n=1 Tax=Panicum miliaceum TaxID=4540 RepID=A0A3L6RK39_PANMI|nr:hypothetical protein C2845_PM13G05100 [Panicum miliaceum]